MSNDLELYKIVIDLEEELESKRKVLKILGLSCMSVWIVYALIFTFLISCENPSETIRTVDGHTYLRDRDYKHDPKCGKCQQMEKK